MLSFMSVEIIADCRVPSESPSPQSNPLLAISYSIKELYLFYCTTDDLVMMMEKQNRFMDSSIVFFLFLSES